MFVFLRGHRILEYYFATRDARAAANDVLHPHSAANGFRPRKDP
jgi:hypothetical protein